MIGLAGFERLDVPVEAGNDFHIVGNLLLFGRQILFTKEHVKYLGFIIHGRDGGPAGIPRAAPAAIIDTHGKGRESRITAHLLCQYLIQ